MKIEIVRSRSLFNRQRWHWRTRHRNGRIGVRSETYHNRSNCLGSVFNHQHFLTTAPIEEIE